MMAEKTQMSSLCSAAYSRDVELVKLAELKAFSRHPFKVKKDAGMYILMQSIKEEGVLVPLLIRKCKSGERYEIISGHRRKLAAEWSGLTEVPAIIKDLSDVQAVIAMVDSNLQRERILPSEKAFAYKMKLEAMKCQGRRTDLTSVQLDPKLRSNEILAKQVGESVAQIKRYIRLTNLIPKLLTMVDENRLALNSAVDLSYLSEEEQYEVHAVMDLEQVIPNLSQSNRLKRMSHQGSLDMDEIYTVLEEVKGNQREAIKIPLERIKGYFPENYTPKKQITLIESLLQNWARENLK